MLSYFFVFVGKYPLCLIVVFADTRSVGCQSNALPQSDLKGFSSVRSHNLYAVIVKSKAVIQKYDFLLKIKIK